MVKRIKFENEVTFGAYLALDAENIEIDDLLVVGLSNGEILLLNDDKILSKKRDVGKAISYLQAADELLIAAAEKSVYFYTIRKDDFKLEKNGFIQNLSGKVLSVDISSDNRYAFVYQRIKMKLEKI